MLKKSKKGAVEGISNGFYALMFIAIAIVVVVIIAAFGADFTNDQQDDIGEAACAARGDAFTDYNVTAKQCQNATGTNKVAVGTAAFNITVDGLASMNTLSEGTEDVTDVSIIAIILMLLVAIIAVFGYMGYKKMS